MSRRIILSEVGGMAKRWLALQWLDEKRLILYGGVVIGFAALLLLRGILSPDPHPPPRVDFLAFHAAAWLALKGEAAAAYEWVLLRQAQAALLALPPAALEGYLGWLNPPHFLLILAPFALFGYGPAWAVWLLFGLIVFALAAWAILPRPAALIAALAAPPLFLCFAVGQNGALIAALMACFLVLVDRRPVWAGIALGLLTIKPHFGPIFPLLLLFSGHLRPLLAAAATVGLLMGLSFLLLGQAAWGAFLALPATTIERYLAAASPVLPKIQSVFATVLWLSHSWVFAVVMHAVVGGGALVVICRLWSATPQAEVEVRAAAAMAGAFLLTPYAWTYDMPAITLAVLFLARAARTKGWTNGEKLTLLLIPAAFLLTVVWPLPCIGPIGWGVILILAWRQHQSLSAMPPHRTTPLAAERNAPPAR